MKDYVYLDNAASMPVSPEILDAFKGYSKEYFANPEAVHHAGRNSKLAISDASRKMSSALTGDSEYSLAWTSSATEAINIAISFPGFAGKNIVTTEAEHPAMLHAVEGADFCEIRKAELTNDGLLNLQDFEEILDESVGVIAIHHVQNETGAVQNLVEIRKIIDKICPDALFVVDTVQSVAKLAIPWSEAQINIGFVAGHKIGAPSGGALIYKLQKQSKQPFVKYLNNIRTILHSIGRPDPAICLTLAEAVIKAETENTLCRISSLSKSLRKKLTDLASQNNSKIIFPVPDDVATPFITMFLIPPYQGEVLVRMLSEKGVMVSAGSACEASKDKPSKSLMAMGISSANARCALRVSFSFDSTKEDIDRFIKALCSVMEMY